jgi:hypothetical protein
MVMIGDLLGEAHHHPDRISEIRGEINTYQENDLMLAESIFLNEIEIMRSKTKYKLMYVGSLTKPFLHLAIEILSPREEALKAFVPAAWRPIPHILNAY